MKRWLTHLTIAGYLGLVLYGLFCHALKFNTGSHVGMYFLVWDMYSGFCAYESRLHIVGEGESGQVYQLAPGPWGDFHPFGDISRHHYDVHAQFADIIAMHTLRHSAHEPMRRILVFEECWSKKYNLPDHLWNLRYDEPKDPMSYFHARAVIDRDGQYSQRTSDFPSLLAGLSIMNNPRLQQDVSRGQPFIALDPVAPRSSSVVPAGFHNGVPTNW